jgi:hypothetical protein
MKNVFRFLTVLSVLISINSCRTKDGAPGPAGSSDLINQGSVSGTLSYVDYKGDSVGVPFNYQYYATLGTNQFTYNDTNSVNSGYTFTFSRRDIADADDIISFNLSGGLDSKGNPVTPNSPQSTADLTFSFMEKLNGSLFTFSGDPYWGDTGSSVEISNFSLDTLTGKLFFNFIITYQSYDISPSVGNNTAYLKGSVNVILNRNRYVVIVG